MTADSIASLDDLELELRLLPGVVGVGFSNEDERVADVTITAREPEGDLVSTAERIARAYRTAATVALVVLDAPIGPPPAPVPPQTLLERVRLVAAGCDEQGVSQVHLSVSGQECIGRAAGGPLVGAAAATLEALAQLGIGSGVTLSSVSTVSGLASSPVRVILDRPTGDAWVGFAQATSDPESACRATLDAFNRLTGVKRPAAL
jgi:hypothetical protein